MGKKKGNKSSRSASKSLQKSKSKVVATQKRKSSDDEATNINENHSADGIRTRARVQEEFPSTSGVESKNKVVKPRSSLNRENSHGDLSAPRAMKVPKTDAAAKNQNKAQAEFEEGDTLMRMTVDPADSFLSDDEDGDDIADQSEDESDGEITTDRGSSDGEGDRSDNDDEVDQSLPQSDAEPMDLNQTPVKKVDKNKKRRLSMESKLDTMQDTINNLQQIVMAQNESLKEARKQAEELKGPGGAEAGECRRSNSGTTIHRNALNKIPVNADSEITFNLKAANNRNIETKGPSQEESDEPIDTSDELMEIDNVEMQERFIAECQAEARRRRSTSTRPRSPPPPPENQDHGEEMTREAEMSKARLLPTRGNSNLPVDEFVIQDSYSSVADENYLVIGGNLDQSLKQKIINHEYIDFACLLPKGRLAMEQDTRMELINKGGATYFVPVADCELAGIHNFAKWEQAFRVFSNVYTHHYPSRATELIQYNHVIHTATTTYIWENVYTYDREFRMRLSHFPHRSWAIILQQAWSMYLKDKIPKGGFQDNWGANNTGVHKDICKRFNKGICTKGFSCKYDHRCAVPECGKFGHGAHICRLKKGGSQGNNNNIVVSAANHGANSSAGGAKNK